MVRGLRTALARILSAVLTHTNRVVPVCCPEQPSEVRLGATDAPVVTWPRADHEAIHAWRRSDTDSHRGSSVRVTRGPPVLPESSAPDDESAQEQRHHGSGTECAGLDRLGEAVALAWDAKRDLRVNRVALVVEGRPAS